MKIESTDETFRLESLGLSPGIAVRLWVGKTAAGVPVHAWVALISPQTHDPEVERAFALEFMEQHVLMPESSL